MKKLLTLASILLLSGCVTYYYPETALEDGVYYAEDDPSYVISSDGYYNATYYPWSSLDYFYLGYSGGFSFGLRYYSPWYYHPDYYGYYSPWYAWHAPYYHYSHYYAWRPYNGHHYNNYGRGNNHYGNKHDTGKGYKKDYRNDNDYRYAGNGNNHRGNRRGEHSDDVKRPAGRNSSTSYASGKKAAPVKGYVSTTPSGHSGNRGMEVRSRGSKNTGKIRTQPIGNDTVTGIKLEPSTRRTTQTNYRSKRSSGSAGEVRYSAGAKQGRSRIQPVESVSNSNRYAMSSPSPRLVATSGNNGRYAHSAPVIATGQASSRTASGQVSSHTPSRSSSKSTAGSRSHSSSGGSKRSHSSSSSSGSRNSSQSKSARHQQRK